MPMAARVHVRRIVGSATGPRKSDDVGVQQTLGDVCDAAVAEHEVEVVLRVELEHQFHTGRAARTTRVLDPLGSSAAG